MTDAAIFAAWALAWALGIAWAHISGARSGARPRPPRIFGKGVAA